MCGIWNRTVIQKIVQSKIIIAILYHRWSEAKQRILNIYHLWKLKGGQNYNERTHAQTNLFKINYNNHLYNRENNSNRLKQKPMHDRRTWHKPRKKSKGYNSPQVLYMILIYVSWNTTKTVTKINLYPRHVVLAVLWLSANIS